MSQAAHLQEWSKSTPPFGPCRSLVRWLQISPQFPEQHAIGPLAEGDDHLNGRENRAHQPFVQHGLQLHSQRKQKAPQLRSPSLRQLFGVRERDWRSLSTCEILLVHPKTS